MKVHHDTNVFNSQSVTGVLKVVEDPRIEYPVIGAPILLGYFFDSVSSLFIFFSWYASIVLSKKHPVSHNFTC